MSDTKFANRCQACQHDNGIINPNGQSWSGNIRVNCELGVHSTIGQGCKKFLPKINGCMVDCFYYNNKNNKCNKGHNIYLFNKCFDYSVKDWCSEPIDYDEEGYNASFFWDNLPYKPYRKENIVKIIDLYKEYSKQKMNLASGLDGELNAYIHLTSSAIHFSQKTLDIVSQVNNIYFSYENRKDELISINSINQDENLRNLFYFIELHRHEVVHLLQKHIYSSVFSYVRAIQEIEHNESVVLASFFQDGYKFDINQSFMDSIYDYLSDKHETDSVELYLYFNSLENSCKTALQAIKIFSNQISLIHLLEAQALFTSRLYLGIDLFNEPKNDIYTLAWGEFKKHGGKNPLVFILIIDASLRYGGLGEDIPHPVEIFNFLISLSKKLEELFEFIGDELENLERPKPRAYAFQLFTGIKSDFAYENNYLEFNDRLTNRIDNLVCEINKRDLENKFFHRYLENLPKDMSLELIQEYQVRTRQEIDLSFINQDCYDYSLQNISIIFAKQLSRILSNILYSIEKNICKKIDITENYAIHNIAYLFKKHFPNYKDISLFIDFAVSSDNYTQKISLFYKELNDINIEMYDIEYFQYEQVLKIIEFIKSILALNSDETSLTDGIFCCDKHSYCKPDKNTSLNQLIENLDSCQEDSSITRFLCREFNKKSVLDFFNF